MEPLDAPFVDVARKPIFVAVSGDANRIVCPTGTTLSTPACGQVNVSPSIATGEPDTRPAVASACFERAYPSPSRSESVVPVSSKMPWLFAADARSDAVEGYGLAGASGPVPQVDALAPST